MKADERKDIGSLLKSHDESTGYGTIKWLTNGLQLHHLRLEIQGLEVKGWVVNCWYSE